MHGTSTTESFIRGLAISALIGLLPGGMAYYAASSLWQPLGIIAAVAAWSAVTFVFLRMGYDHIRIPYAYTGVGVRFGNEPTGTLYSPGDHWGFPGITAAIPVDTRHRRVDLTEKFGATAGDTSDVGVDGFMLVRVVDPMKLLAVSDPDESWREMFESRVRLFTSLVKNATSAIQFKDLLADYLELEPLPERSSPAYARIKAAHDSVKVALDALADDHVVGGKNGVEDLMHETTAGALKRITTAWGFFVEEVEIEEFGIPQVIKDANLRKATQSVLMDAERIRNTARAEMIDELVKKGVHPNVANNSVDLLLGLAVKKDIREITITDLEKVAGVLGQSITQALVAILGGRTSNTP